MKHSVLISLLWLAASVAVQSQTIPPSFLDKSVRTGFSTFTYYDIFGQPVTTMGGIISVNGVFTYHVLHGLSGRKADLNKDGAVHLTELLHYVQQQVLISTEGRQRPTSRLENVSNDIRIW